MSTRISEDAPLLPLLYTFLNLVELNIVTYRGRDTLDRLMNLPPEQDPFPKPVRLSPNRVAWPADAVRQWVQRRIDAGTRVPKPKPPRKIKSSDAITIADTTGTK